MWAASLGAAIVTSGVQGIAPAIPVIQDHFGLSDAQVALVTSMYLLPGIFSAFLAGLLADRLGERVVFVGSLVLYGASAGLLLFDPSFGLVLVARFIQGVSFGAVMSQSVGLIGSVAPTGAEAARGQSRRIISMAASEAVFPVLAGAILAVSWFAPFALQLIAIPIGVLAWFWMPKENVRARRAAGKRPPVSSLAHEPALIWVQILAALRFIFKFAVMTYYPVLAVNVVGMSPAAVGYAVGACGLLAAVAAALTEKLAGRWRSSQLIGGCLAAIVVCCALIGLGGNAWLITLGLCLYGIQDGVYGVSHNVLVTEMAPKDLRQTYVGLTGTVRNVGKFVAPLMFGAATLALSIAQSFVALAAVGVVSVEASRRVLQAQRRMETAEVAERPADGSVLQPPVGEPAVRGEGRDPGGADGRGRSS